MVLCHRAVLVARCCLAYINIHKVLNPGCIFSVEALSLNRQSLEAFQRWLTASQTVRLCHTGLSKIMNIYTVSFVRFCASATDQPYHCVTDTSCYNLVCSVVSCCSLEHSILTVLPGHDMAAITEPKWTTCIYKMCGWNWRQTGAPMAHAVRLWAADSMRFS